MGYPYLVLAKRPNKDQWEKCRPCETLEGAMLAVQEFQSAGYWVISVQIADSQYNNPELNKE